MKQRPTSLSLAFLGAATYVYDVQQPGDDGRLLLVQEQAVAPSP